MRVADAKNQGMDIIVSYTHTRRFTDFQAILKSLLLLTKPGIVLAEVLAGVAGALIASPYPEPRLLWTAMLCIAMAAAGAAMLNGLMEEKTDSKMLRLAKRTHALETAGRWLVWKTSCLLLFGAALITVTSFPPLVMTLLAAAALGYTVVYTAWLKHRTPWSVLAGGIPGALPPLIGAAAVSGTIPATSLLLGLLIYVWQLPHFWFLAMQYREEYQLAGIPVLPVTHGIRTTGVLILTASTALLAVSMVFSLSAGHQPSFMAMLAGAYCYFLFLGYRYLYRTKNYRKGFRVSILLMNGTLLAVILNVLLNGAG